MPSIRLPAPADLNPVARVQSVLGWLGNADGRRQRRTSVSADGHRAHIEVRGAQRPERAGLVRDVKVALDRLDGRRLGRGRCRRRPRDRLLRSRSGRRRRPRRRDRSGRGAARRVATNGSRTTVPTIPADREPIQRHVFAIAADVVGVGFATGMQALRVVRDPGRDPGPGLDRRQSAARAAPAREPNRPPRGRRDVGDGQRALTSARSRTARPGRRHRTPCRAWSASSQRSATPYGTGASPRSCDARESLRHRALTDEPRPVPLPAGPVERYADRAARRLARGDRA